MTQRRRPLQLASMITSWNVSLASIQLGAFALPDAGLAALPPMRRRVSASTAAAKPACAVLSRAIWASVIHRPQARLPILRARPGPDRLRGSHVDQAPARSHLGAERAAQCSASRARAAPHGSACGSPRSGQQGPPVAAAIPADSRQRGSPQGFARQQANACFVRRCHQVLPLRTAVFNLPVMLFRVAAWTR